MSRSRFSPQYGIVDLHFTQIHEKDGAPIETHRYCSEEDVEVRYEEITHGYDCEDGQQVIVTDLEFEAIEPRKPRTIDIEQFGTSTMSIPFISITRTSSSPPPMTTAPHARTGG